MRSASQPRENGGRDAHCIASNALRLSLHNFRVFSCSLVRAYLWMVFRSNKASTKGKRNQSQTAPKVFHSTRVSACLIRVCYHGCLRMKSKKTDLRIVRGLLLVALLFSASPRHNASNFADSNRTGDTPSSVSTTGSLFRVHALTAYSGQLATRVASKQDRLQHSANSRGLATAEFNFGPTRTPRFLAVNSTASYESFRLFSVGGRDPPAAI